MIKEILENENINEDAVKDFDRNMKALGKMMDDAIKKGDKKKLDAIGKDLDKILKGL